MPYIGIALIGNFFGKHQNDGFESSEMCYGTRTHSPNVFDANRPSNRMSENDNSLFISSSDFSPPPFSFAAMNQTQPMEAIQPIERSIVATAKPPAAAGQSNGRRERRTQGRNRNFTGSGARLKTPN